MDLEDWFAYCCTINSKVETANKAFFGNVSDWRLCETKQIREIEWETHVYLHETYGFELPNFPENPDYDPTLEWEECVEYDPIF